MELRQLEYVVAVAEELGYGRAAERLRTDPDSVRVRIAHLERELGVRLFDGASGHLRLTSAGERLLPEARAALAAAARVRETAAGITAGTVGLIRLGTSRAFADRVYRALGTLTAHRPRLRVRLERAPQAARLAAVRSGTFDAALVRTVAHADGVALHPVWSDPLIAALPAGHPLADDDPPRLERLAALPLRLAPREANPAFHDLITAALPDWTPGPPFTTLRETLRELAATPQPSWTVFYPMGVLAPTRRLVFRTLPGLRVPVSLATPPGPLTPPVRALLDALTSGPVTEPDTPARGTRPVVPGPTAPGGSRVPRP
ncbi:LysR family transcriptional regulator [Streptomyces sp. NPDC047928]|uniref:LysR family transcriptional regulator n=1 Tax=unclassified Streptomyces TaxID=2593676 RepID=UPI00371083FA